MNRREAIKAAVAAVGMGPLIWSQILRAVAGPIDLGPFCHEDDWKDRRYHLDRPFEQRGWVYATDLEIAVRVRDVGQAVTEETRRLPPMADLPWSGESERWLVWPKKRWIANPRPGYIHPFCPECRGSGRIGQLRRPCSLCADGVLLDCCPECDGWGEVIGSACAYCGGSGWPDDEKPLLQPVGGVLLAGYFDKLIRTLPEVRYRPTPIRDYRDLPTTAINFRFLGGEGLVMPIDPS